MSVVPALLPHGGLVLLHAYCGAPAAQQFVTQLLFFKSIEVVGGLIGSSCPVFQSQPTHQPVWFFLEKHYVESARSLLFDLWSH